MSLRQHEIAEADHRILNSFTDAKLVDEPPAEAYPALHIEPGEFVDLAGTLARFDDAGLGVVEMVLADGDSWDRYVAAQFWTVERWLHEHPDDPDAPGMRRYLTESRRSYFAYNRRYLGWGVFVSRSEGS